MSAGTQRAPEGQIWVCASCGKTSPTQYGFDETGKHVGDPWWDSSCMSSAVLCWQGGPPFRPVETSA